MQLCIMGDVSDGKMRVFSCMLESVYKEEKINLCSGPEGNVGPAHCIGDGNLERRKETALCHIIEADFF